MHRMALVNDAPQPSSSALTDALCAALGGRFVDELMVQSLYCLASQIIVRRWGAMLHCRVPSQAFAQLGHVCDIDVGLKQRSTLLTRTALSELLVLRLMRFRGAYNVRHPLHHATCVLSRRHFFSSKNGTHARLHEEQLLHEQQRFSDAVTSWRPAALLQLAASNAFLSHMLYTGKQDASMPPADTVLLDCAFQAKMPVLSFLWYTRRFVLCADCTLRRYDGEQLCHSATITRTTRVAELGAVEFTVT